MTEAEKIIYASMAGLIIWVTQKVISYIVFRSRITQSLLSDIKLTIDQIKEANDYLKKLENDCLVEGESLGYIDKELNQYKMF